MDDKKKPFSADSLQVSELDDESLEGVTGGDPVIVNTAPHCGVPAPKQPATTFTSNTE